MSRFLLPLLVVIMIVAGVGFLYVSKKAPPPDGAVPESASRQPTGNGPAPPRAFVSVTSDDVRLLNLSDAGQGNVTGQYSAVVMDSQGRVKSEEALVAGTVEDTKVSLAFTVDGQSAPIHAIGVHDARSFTLTFGFVGEPTKTHVFQSSDVETYKADVEALNGRSSSTLAGKSSNQANQQAALDQRNFDASANELIVKMRLAEQRIDAALSQLPEADAKLHSISAQSNDDFQKAQNLPGRQNLQQRDTLVGDMNQGLIATEQVHTKAQAVKNDFARDVLPLFDQVMQAEKTCASEAASASQVCAKLVEAGRGFNDKCKTLQDALAGLEKSYQDQFSGQQALITQANGLQ